MKAIAITTAVLACILLLLCIRIRICLDFSSKLSIQLRILFIRVWLYPKRRTPKQVIRAQKKQARRAEKKRKKAEEKRKRAGEDRHLLPQDTKRRKTSPRAVLRLAIHLLRAVSRRFPRCFHLYLRRVVIRVGGDDAAEVALRYGGIRAVLSWFCALLDKMFTVRTSRRSELRVDPDFTAGDDAIDLSLVLSARVGSLLALLIRAAIAYLRRPRDPKQTSGKKRSTHATERSTENG